MSFVDNPRHSNRPPVIPAAAGIQGRGRGESHQSQKSHESQFRQLPSRPLVSFVDNPRHSNCPPVIPAAAGIQRGGDVGNPTNHKNHTNHSSDNSLRAPSRPPWTIPVIPTAPHRHSGEELAPYPDTGPESRGAGTWGIPLITIIPRITVQTTPFAPLRVLRGQSPSFQPPTRHSGEGRNPEGRGGGTSHQSQKSHESQFRQPPSRPFVSFVDNPRHSNRPPVIPAKAGIQRGGDVGNPTNHNNPTNHSSDNSLRALSVLRG